MRHRYTAGRFEAVVLDEVSGRINLIERHRNGGDEEMARLCIDAEELEDVLYILQRVKERKRTP